MPRVLKLQNLCDVKLEKSKKAKNIIITVPDVDHARVAVPWWVSFCEAERMVNENIPWIKKRIEKLKNSNSSVIDDGYKTKMHILHFYKNGFDKIIGSINENEMIVEYPWHINHTDKDVQQSAKDLIQKAYRKEAKSYLPHRVFMLSAMHGLVFRKLFIKNARTQWGSCSVNNNINLSIYLMKLPERLIDYVIIHELVHTIEKNHSKNFWAKLDTFTGGAKKLEKELKVYEGGLY